MPQIQQERDVMIELNDKIRLYGFNNLTKTLSFNIYDVCYAKSEREKNAYIAYIDEQYNSDRLTRILCDVTEIIGANVLNISKQDYDPRGASVNILVTEEAIAEDQIDASCNRGDTVGLQNGCPTNPSPNLGLAPNLGPAGDSGAIVGHLDKSHLTVHTYPEFHPELELSTFRVDIDVATCGKVSPLTALNHMIASFDSDIITLDYRVRGFTRDMLGNKFYIDHDITSIQNFIDKPTLRKYDAIDMNIYQSNIFHTKMMVNEINLAHYLFNVDPSELLPSERISIRDRISREMLEIFYGTNIYTSEGIR